MLAGENVLVPDEPVASAVLEGYLEVESLAEGRVKVLRGQGAVALCPLSLVWVSGQMGTATQPGGGGLNGMVLGRQVRAVLQSDREVVIAWGDGSGSGGRLCIRTEDVAGVFEVLSAWAAAVRSRLAELGFEAGG